MHNAPVLLKYELVEEKKNIKENKAIQYLLRIVFI